MANGTRASYAYDNADRVHDFVKKIHDLGFFAGVSTHCPKHVAIIEDSGWENDFYMTCMYYLTRTPEELTTSFAECLKSSFHPNIYPSCDAVIVMTPALSELPKILPANCTVGGPVLDSLSLIVQVACARVMVALVGAERFKKKLLSG